MMVCTKCGKESCVMYLKRNPGLICPECEEVHRQIYGHKSDWKSICERMGYEYKEPEEN